MTVFAPGQFLGGQRGEHAGGPFGLFTVLVVGVLTSRGASEDHVVSPVLSMGPEFSDEPSKSNRPYLIRDCAHGFIPVWISLTRATIF
jgi:hypothetical protein